jgi:Flp pilus assembly protein TadD
MQGRFHDAVRHLEIGRKLEPDNPAVYSNLASAYQQLGEREKARQMREQTGRLLAEKKSATNQPQP